MPPKQKQQVALYVVAAIACIVCLALVLTLSPGECDDRRAREHLLRESFAASQKSPGGSGSSGSGSSGSNGTGDALKQQFLSVLDFVCKPGGTALMSKSRLLRASDTLNSNACMVDSIEHHILKEPGSCSKNNAALYKPKFARVVDNISVQDAITGIAKCVIDMKPGATKRDLSSYDSFLRKQMVLTSPHYKHLLQLYNDLVEAIRTIKGQIKAMQFDLRAEATKTAACNASVASLFRNARNEALAASQSLGPCRAQLMECNKRLQRKLAEEKMAQMYTMIDDQKNKQYVTLFDGCKDDGNKKGSPIATLRRSKYANWTGAQLRGFEGLPNNNNFEDKIDGVEVSAGANVTLYQHSNMTGQTKVLGPGFQCIKNHGWNNKVSAIKFND
jgi:hypothetical protein